MKRNRKKILAEIILGIFLITFISSIQYTKPGIYTVTKGDYFVLNDSAAKISDIKINEETGEEMVYIVTPGLGFYAYVGKRIDLTREKYATEKPIAIVVNHIDLQNKKAEVEFIDNYAEGCKERTGRACHRLSLYWMDSCGRRQNFIKKCEEGCSHGLYREAICGEDEGKRFVIINPNKNPEEIPKSDTEVYTCIGCTQDNICFPIGYRKEGNYCSEGEKPVLMAQKQKEQNCEKDFECTSNYCKSGKCADKGLFRIIGDWFKNLFN